MTHSAVIDSHVEELNDEEPPWCSSARLSPGGKNRRSDKVTKNL